MKRVNNYISMSDGVFYKNSRLTRFFNNRILERLFACFFLLAGIYGCMNTFAQAYLDRSDIGMAFIMVSIFSLVLLFILDLNGRARKIAALIFVLALATYIWFEHEKFMLAAEGTYYVIMKWVGWYMGDFSVTTPNNITYIQEHLFVEMCLVYVLPWTILFSTSWSVKGHSYGGVIALTIYISLYFAGGYMPEFIDLILMISSVVGTFIKVPLYNGENTNKTGIWITNIRKEIAFIFLILVAVFSYETLFVKLNTVLLPVQNWIYDDFSLNKVIPDENLNGKNKSEGGISGGKTGNGGASFEPKNTIILKATYKKDVDHEQYLAAYVADTYTGQGWVNECKPLSIYTEDEVYQAFSAEYNLIADFNNYLKFMQTESDYNSFISKFSSNDVTIEGLGDDVAKNGYICRPYISYVTAVDGKIMDGFYLKRKTVQSLINEYSFYDYKDGFSSKTEDNIYKYAGSIKENPEYYDFMSSVNMLWSMSDYAYTYCTKVPDFLQKIRDKYSSYSWNSYDEAVNYVKKELTDGFVYDTRPGKVPANKDYIEYFLFESKRGYCMYYASAATVMFRSMGIPARYVEGFIVPAAKAGKTVNVKDCNAHAWTEIFVDGFGWIPVEVTNATFTGNGFVPIHSEAETSVHQSSAAQHTTQHSNASTEATTAHATKTSNTTKSNDDNGNGKNGLPKAVSIVLLVIVGIAALLVAEELCYYIYYSGKLRRCRSLGFRKRLLAIYKRIYHLTKGKCPVTAEGNISEIAAYWELDEIELESFKNSLMEAEFSNEKTTPEDCSLAEKIEKLIIIRKKNRASGIKKLYYLRMLGIRRKIYARKRL